MTIEAILDVLKENHLDTPGNLAKLTARINDSKDPNKDLLIDNVFKALIFLKQQDSLTEKNLNHIYTLLEPEDGSSLANWLELAEPYFFLVTSPSYGFKTTNAIDKSLTQLIELVTFDYDDEKEIWFKFLSSYIQDSIPNELQDKALHILSILVINESIQQPDFVKKTKVIKKLLESLLDNSRSDIKAKINIANALGMITSYFYDGEIVDARIMALFKKTQTRIKLIELFKSTSYTDLKDNILTILFNIFYDLCEVGMEPEACAPVSKLMTEAGIIPSLIDYLKTDESENTNICFMISLMVPDNIDAVKQMESLDITRILISSIHIHGDQIFQPLKSLSDMQLKLKQLPEQIIADQVLPILERLIMRIELEEEYTGRDHYYDVFMLSCIGNYIKSNSLIILGSIKSEGFLNQFLKDIIDEHLNDSNKSCNGFESYVHPYQILKRLAYDVECHKALMESGAIDYLMEQVTHDKRDGKMPLAILRMISRRKVETTVQILSLFNPFKNLGPDVQSKIASMTGMPEIDTPESAFCSAESHLN